MLSLTSAIQSFQMMQTLLPVMEYPFRFATPENDWENLFAKYIPSWLSVSNKSILQPYYEGESTLYIGKHIKLWVIRNRSGHESISVCIVNSIHIYAYFGRCDQATG